MKSTQPVCIYTGLKCSSMFVCFKDHRPHFVDSFLLLEFTHSQNAEKSIIHLSCINCSIGSVSSIHDKSFLKHCAASLVNTSFLSSPSSSSLLHTLLLSVESLTTLAKISSSDVFQTKTVFLIPNS